MKSNEVVRIEHKVRMKVQVDEFQQGYPICARSIYSVIYCIIKIIIYIKTVATNFSKNESVKGSGAFETNIC